MRWRTNFAHEKYVSIKFNLILNIKFDIINLLNFIAALQEEMIKLKEARSRSQSMTNITNFAESTQAPVSHFKDTDIGT